MKQWINNCVIDAVVVAKLLVLVAVPTGLLLFHVWNQYQITAVGYEIAEVTTEHRKLLEENKKLTVEARLQGRSDRVTRVARDHYGLREARPEQVIKVSLDGQEAVEEHARLDGSEIVPTSIVH